MCMLVTPVLLADDLMFQAVTNRSPEIAIPSGWSYGSAPGVYFWTGFSMAFVAGLWGWGASFFRHAVEE